MDRTLLIDEVPISEYELYYKELPVIPTPERDVEYIDIKGRDGELTKKYGYKNIPYPIDLYFYENKPFRKSFRKLKHHLLNAKTITFADDDEVYYKVKAVQIDDADTNIYKVGMFTVEFTLDPFQYEVSNGPQAITTQTTIINPGYESEPIITVHCGGTGKVYVNDVLILIQNVNGTITIDSEMQNAYRKNLTITENMNKHMIGEFPVLGHGNNVIKFDGDISKLELIKNGRWL